MAHQALAGTALLEAPTVGGVRGVAWFGACVVRGKVWRVTFALFCRTVAWCA